MSNSALLTINGNTLVLSGAINVSTVSGILIEGRLALGDIAETTPSLDLSAVTSADSAGLALVVDWVRSAHQRGSQLTIIGAPQQLRDIAKVSGLEKMFDSGFRARFVKE